MSILYCLKILMFSWFFSNLPFSWDLSGRFRVQWKDTVSYWGCSFPGVIQVYPTCCFKLMWFYFGFSIVVLPFLAFLSWLQNVFTRLVWRLQSVSVGQLSGLKPSGDFGIHSYGLDGVFRYSRSFICLVFLPDLLYVSGCSDRTRFSWSYRWT